MLDWIHFSPGRGPALFRRRIPVTFPFSRFLLRTVAAIVTATLLVVGGAIWRLSHGPVSVGFLAPYLQDALSYGESGLQASVEDAILTWSRSERTLEIRALDVALRDATGVEVARVPDMALTLSVPALLEGRVAPTAIDLAGVEARVTRDESGRFDLGFGAPPEVAPGPEGSGSTTTFLSLLTRSSAPGGNLAYLRRVSIVAADVTLFDEPSGILWRAPRSDLILWRDANGLRADVTLNVETGQRTARVVANARIDRETLRADVAARFEQLDPGDIAHKVDGLKVLTGVSLPLSGTLTFVVGADRKLSAMSFDAMAMDGRVGVPDLFPDPIPVGRISTRGRIDDTFKTIEIDELAIDSAGAAIKAKGVVSLAGGFGVTADGELRNLAVDRLGVYWPRSAARNAREWILRNVRGGTVPTAKFQVKLAPADLASGRVPADALVLDFGLAGSTVDYLNPMPKLTEVTATAHLTSRQLDIAVSHGKAGPLDLSEGTITITGLSERDQVAEIRFTTRGMNADVLALIDNPPLALVSKLGIKPSSVGGTTTVRTRLRVPLENKLTFDDIGVSAEADLVGVTIPAVYENINLSNGNLSLQADTKRLEVKGTAALNDVPVNLRWAEQFALQGPFSSRYEVNGTIDDAGRKALGFDTGTLVTGPVVTDMAIDANAKGQARIRLGLDLAKAKLDVPDIHWSKEAGIAGRAEASITTDPGQPLIADIVAKAGDLEAAGKVALRQGSFVSADVKRLDFAGNRVAGRIERRADGVYVADLSGAQADLKPFLDDAFKAAPVDPNPTGPNIIALLRFDRATLDENSPLDQLDARLELRAGKLRDLEAKAALPHNGTLSARIKPEAKVRRVSLQASDASFVMRYLGIAETRGGTLALEGEFQDDQHGAPIKARAKIDNITIVDAPILARLLAVGSFQGLAALLTGQGISFTRVDLPFTMVGSKLNFEDARAYGSALGLTMEGTIDTSNDALSISGTLVPAYAINSLLGNIPLLGPLIVGRQGEGIFGVTYRIDGLISSPGVFVNPLSALAPGFLRRLFELQASANPQPDPPAVVTTPLPPPNQQ